MAEPTENRRSSSGISGEGPVRIEEETGGGSSGNSVELESTVARGHGGSSSTGL